MSVMQAIDKGRRWRGWQRAGTRGRVSGVKVKGEAREKGLDGWTHDPTSACAPALMLTLTLTLTQAGTSLQWL